MTGEKYCFFNETHEEIRRLARDFAERELSPIAAEVDKKDSFPMTLVQQMSDLGFLGLKIPEEYGGTGMDVRSYVCVMEEIAKKCPAATIFISSANSLSTEPLLLYGTKEQKQQYVPGVAAGEFFIAFALTEPGAGSDAASLVTKAKKEGESYILSGRKCFITLAPMARYSVIFARTDPEKGARGITAFMVDMSLPGVSCGKNEDKMGQRGVPVSDIILENVRVPSSCIIGEVDKGFVNAMKSLNVGRIGIAAMSLGMAEEALHLAIEYTKIRKQFGKPLAEHQALRFMMADLQTKLSAARLLTYDAAYRMDAGEDSVMAASMAKYYAAEAAKDIVDQALQLHGGYGYSREYEIERLYRDVRVNSIYEGSSQIQQIVISGQLLK